MSDAHDEREGRDVREGRDGHVAQSGESRGSGETRATRETEIDITVTLSQAERLRDEQLVLRGATSVTLTTQDTEMTDRLLNTLVVQIAEAKGQIVRLPELHRRPR